MKIEQVELTRVRVVFCVTMAILLFLGSLCLGGDYRYRSSGRKFNVDRWQNNNQHLFHPRSNFGSNYGRSIERYRYVPAAPSRRYYTPTPRTRRCN